MSVHRAWRRVVSRDGEHVRFFAQQNRQGGIEILNGFHLGGEVAVFAGFVGVFVMDEKEIKVVVLSNVTFELLRNRLRPLDFLHADELRKTLVHRIDRQRGGLELIAFLEQWNFGERYKLKPAAL